MVLVIIIPTCGCRYGFVGRNGLGKTTLLRMISEKQLMIPSHISVLHVEQEVGVGVKSWILNLCLVKQKS